MSNKEIKMQKQIDKLKAKLVKQENKEAEIILKFNLDMNRNKKHIAELEAELAEMVRENECLKDRLVSMVFDNFDESELGAQEEAL